MRIALIVLASIVNASLLAQVGGQRSFEFLNIPADGMVFALGGVSSTFGTNQFVQNPGLIVNSESGEVALSYVSYVGGIGLSQLNYVSEFSKIGKIGAAITYFNYGNFKGTDNTGAATNEFSAADWALELVYGNQANNFSFGGGIKLIHSGIGGFGATAIAADFGGAFIHPSKDFVVGLTINNIGFVVSEYSETSDSKLPLDLGLGMSLKPEHMPVRFHVSAYHLQKPDVAYSNLDDPFVEDNNIKVTDFLLRHLTVGTEVLFSKHVAGMVGYNHLRHQELKLPSSGGAAGWNFGFKLAVKKWTLVYAHSTYNSAGGSNSFTLTTNVKKVFFRKEIS